MDTNDAPAAGVEVAEGPGFHSSTITPSADGYDLAAIVAASREHIAKEDGAPTCPHSYVRGWDLRKCERCDADVGGERFATEQAHKAAAELEDSSIDTSERGERLRARGVTIAFLLAFTKVLECWDWPTWRVVRDTIKPATEARGRRRFAELDEVAPHTGPATVFMSHCWGAEWGGLVMAACAGARHDRVVWIDVFAVRARALGERFERGGRRGAGGV